MLDNLAKIAKVFSVPYRDGEQPYVFISTELDTNALDSFGIVWEPTPEGIRVDLDKQKKIRLFKTKKHFFDAAIESDFEKNLIIIESKDTCAVTGEETSCIFSNVKYSMKFFSLLIGKEVAQHHDAGNGVLILLSEKMGKHTIGYTTKKHNSEKNLNLQAHYDAISHKMESDAEFVKFFRNCIIDRLSLHTDEKNGYFYLLENLGGIYENALRNFELYQAKFDFKDFEESLLDAKRKYFEKYFDFQSAVLSKIHGFPIQYGIYIFLLIRFSDEVWGLIATIILLLAWSFMSWRSVETSKKELKRFQDDFKSTVKRIGKDSKLSSFDPKPFYARMEDHDKMIVAFQRFTVYSSIAFLIIAIGLLVSLHSDFPMSLVCWLYEQCELIKK